PLEINGINLPAGGGPHHGQGGHSKGTEIDVEERTTYEDPKGQWYKTVEIPDIAPGKFVAVEGVDPFGNFTEGPEAVLIRKEFVDETRFPPVVAAWDLTLGSPPEGWDLVGAYQDTSSPVRDDGGQLLDAGTKKFLDNEPYLSAAYLNNLLIINPDHRYSRDLLRKWFEIIFSVNPVQPDGHYQDDTRAYVGDVLFNDPHFYLDDNFPYVDANGTHHTRIDFTDGHNGHLHLEVHAPLV